MKVVGLGMALIGILLMVEAWESHKTQTPPSPIAHAQQAISSAVGNTATASKTATTPSG